MRCPPRQHVKPPPQEGGWQRRVLRDARGEAGEVGGVLGAPMHNCFSLLLMFPRSPSTCPGTGGALGRQYGVRSGVGGLLGAGEQLSVSKDNPGLRGAAPWPPRLVSRLCHRLQHHSLIIIHVSGCVSFVLLIMFAA